MRAPASVGTLFVAIFMLASCAEHVPEIMIVANQMYGEGCDVPVGSSTTSLRTRGTLDLFITDQYRMIPKVENTLVASGSVGFGGGGGGQGGLSGAEWEGNDIFLRRATIRFEAPDALGVPLPRELDVELSGRVEPGGEATVELQAISPSIGRTLANSRLLREARTSLTIDQRLKFYGETSTGAQVDSNEFIYPLELCYGCLLDIPPEAIDTEFAVQPNCRNLDTESEGESQVICFAGQDEPVDCRAVCPIVTAIPNGDPEGICEAQVSF